MKDNNIINGYINQLLKLDKISTYKGLGTINAPLELNAFNSMEYLEYIINYFTDDKIDYIVYVPIWFLVKSLFCNKKNELTKIMFNNIYKFKIHNITFIAYKNSETYNIDHILIKSKDVEYCGHIRWVLES